MPIILLKDLLRESSVWAKGTGVGSQATHFTTSQGRRSTTKYGKDGDKYKIWRSEEYTLTPEEEEALKSMDDKQRYAFHKRKERKARRDKGLCQRCKAPLNVPPGQKQPKHCPPCAHEAAEYKRKVRARNICPQCFVNPLAIKKDGTLAASCQICLDRTAKLHVDYLQRVYTDKGICNHCYKNPVFVRPDGSKSKRCASCMEKYKLKAREKTRQNLPIDYSIE